MPPASISPLLRQRVKNQALLAKLRTAEECVPLFKDNMWLGWSGFTGVGGPKAVPEALSDHVEKNNLQGKLRFSLITGASTDVDVESRWANLDMITRRTPHQVGRDIRKAINSQGYMKFFDKHLSMVPQDLLYGYLTHRRDTPEQQNSIDFALIEASEIKEDGSLVLGPSVGAAPELAQYAQNIIIEVNTSIPSFEGLHDINMAVNPPHRVPYNVTTVSERMGSPYLQIDPSKVVAVVESNLRDNVPDNSPADDVSRAIGTHLVEFFEHEVKHGRMPENLHPLQSGIGNIANAVIDGLAGSRFQNLTVWTEVLQDSFLEFFENGKLDFATATSIRLTPHGFKRFFDNWDAFSKKVLLRPESISNHPELIRRLGVIAMNTPVEVDLYGHANSTNVNGSRMLNGLGGSGDFLRNAKYSIMHFPSARPSKTDPFGVSSVVPMVPHVDHTEHDTDVFVTEQGLADLRGLAPRERSREIIKHCAHPYYRDQLTDYIDHAEKLALKTRSMHEPQILENVFKMHLNLDKQGTMKLDSW